MIIMSSLRIMLTMFIMMMILLIMTIVAATSKIEPHCVHSNSVQVR